MRSAVGGILLAIVLFASAYLAGNEARVTRQVATAHQRLATLHYDSDDGIDEGASMLSRLPWSGSAVADVKTHRATVSYWLSRYDKLSDLSNVTGSQAVNDPALLLVAANAAFRAIPPPVAPADRKPTIDKLDGVIQSYADILRRDPARADAAFNYEFVYRIRDGLSKLPPNRNPGRDPKEKDKKEAPADVSIDLPTGPTIHGRPGGPPDGTDMSDFKTISPMRYDEREEQMDPGQGRKLQRKG
jgi:hypothetical protein